MMTLFYLLNKNLIKDTVKYWEKNCHIFEWTNIWQTHDGNSPIALDITCKFQPSA